MSGRALWPFPPSPWVGRSPDDDEWIEAVDGADPDTGPSAARPLRARAGGAPPLYRLRDKLEESELKGAMIRVLGQAVAAGRAGVHATGGAGQDEDSNDVRLVIYFGATKSALMQLAVRRCRHSCELATRFETGPRLGHGRGGRQPC